MDILVGGKPWPSTRNRQLDEVTCHIPHAKIHGTARSSILSHIRQMTGVGSCNTLSVICFFTYFLSLGEFMMCKNQTVLVHGFA